MKPTLLFAALFLAGCSMRPPVKPGGDAQATTNLTVFAAVSTITITPANSSCTVGQTVNFHAVDQTGRDITAESTWSSSSPAEASINATTGVAMCLAPSPAQTPVVITATHP